MEEANDRACQVAQEGETIEVNGMAGLNAPYWHQAVVVLHHDTTASGETHRRQTRLRFSDGRDATVTLLTPPQFDNGWMGTASDGEGRRVDWRLTPFTTNDGQDTVGDHIDEAIDHVVKASGGAEEEGAEKREQKGKLSSPSSSRSSRKGQGGGKKGKGRGKKRR